MNRSMEEVMTPAPHTIGRNQTLSAAHKVMRKYKIRHLPVLDGGKLVGILSQRDLYFLEAIAGVDVEVDKVEDAMSGDVYEAAPDATVGDVAGVMAKKGYGCAVVVDDKSRPIGIFTCMDALRLLVKPPTKKRAAERSTWRTAER